MDLEAAVMKNKEAFNETDKAIVSYLLQYPEAASKLSLMELAQKLYVSKSAIFRLSKKLGLSGFSELKFELSELTAKKAQREKYAQGLNFDANLQKILEETVKYFKGLNLTDCSMIWIALKQFIFIQPVGSSKSLRNIWPIPFS